MFSKSRLSFGKSRLIGKNTSTSSGGKKHSSRAWMNMNKKRHQEHEQPRSRLEMLDDDDDDNSVMMSTDTSPTLTASLQSAGYVELPDEPRPGKITPTTSTTNTTNSSPSPRAATSRSNGGGGGGSSSSHEEEEVIEEAEVPIVRTTLPSPEPRPLIERNGYKELDRLDGVAVANNNGLKKPAIQERRDIDEDSCLIKCVYFTQQCCDCVIV